MSNNIELNDFVNQNIFSCVSTMVEYILSRGHMGENTPFSYDDITNNDPTGEVVIDKGWESLTIKERDEKLEFYQYLLVKGEELLSLSEEVEPDFDVNEHVWEKWCSKLTRIDNLVNKYKDTIDNLEAMAFCDYPEIYAWYMVSPYLARRLEAQGECILDGNIWGRQTCGQSVAMDYCIQQAFE